jgi:Xaa-Pro aminopeptidase
MTAPTGGRIGRLQAEMARAGVDAAVVGPSADLRYLACYDAPALERPTLLVVPVDVDPLLVVPALERPRAEAAGADRAARLVSWGETDDPYAAVRAALAGRRRVAVSDTLWARFLLDLEEALPGATFVRAGPLIGRLRARKDPEEVAALRRAAEAADGVALRLAAERVSGRTERELARWIAEALVDAGCERAAFVIVAAGPNAASPHHEPSDREIRPGDALVVDFGGPRDGYCSDITRTFVVGRAPEGFADAWAVLAAAQEAAVAAVRPGVPAEAVDAAARRVIAEAGYGEAFVHRTGHGIGLDVHEDPFIVAGNAEPLEVGMAFSVEPGIYLPGRFGMRLEDIVVVTPGGAERLNHAPHDPVTLR